MMEGTQTGWGTLELIREPHPEQDHKGMKMAREESLQCFKLQESCMPRSPVERQVLPEVQ